MANPISLESTDPFADPVVPSERRHSIEQCTLIAGRSASLTLATDSLIILEAKTTQAIPFFNILWAELVGSDIVIRYAKPTSKDVVKVTTVNYSVEKPEHHHAVSWVARLLDRAYGESQRRKRIKVLVNPFGGKGSAQKLYLRDVEPIFAAARCEIDVERTQFRGHAIEIAEKLEVDAFDVIASCSGDGLPHEVFNGLAKRQDARRALKEVAVVQLPCGTGNAMSWNLNGTDSTSMAALCIVKGIRTPLDLTSITQGGRRTISFLSQSVGIVAESDLATEHLRWLGSTRFTYGFLVRLLGKTVYPCDLAVQAEASTKVQVRERYRKMLNDHTYRQERRYIRMPSESTSTPTNDKLPELKYGSVQDQLPDGWRLSPYDKMGSFYAGNMALMAPDSNFFPAALPNDGCLDLVTIDGDISRIAAVKSMLAVETGKFFDMPHVNYRKITGYRIIPKDQRHGFISIDGERVPFEPFQAEVHEGLGTVLSRSGYVYEAKAMVARNDHI
ncbi:MAG: hypothetical protein LQ342_001681 [Letrouitia transgressa]|nr:MAG: hypothetical protein LQ342_001681 [Letrouitia transgressa]